MRLQPFRMERWQSTFEHRVRFNLSESGVHPMSLEELLAIAGLDLDALTGTRFGYGQSNGSDTLRRRIADLYEGADDGNVLVTVGGAEANFAAFWHLMEPGETAAVMLPNYMQVPGLLDSFGARPVAFHLLEHDDWRPDLDALAAALSGGARFVLVTNPNNPTGRALRPEDMDAIVGLAERHGAWILADEVYRGAEVSGPETPSFWGRTERVLVTHSLSKAYGLPGLRIGWIAGPRDVIASLWGRTDYTTITPATLSDRLAAEALEPVVRRKILERTRGIVSANFDTLAAWMDERAEGVRYTAPDAGAICYVRYDAPIGSADLAERLRTEKDVLVVPGDHFGMDHYLRLGFGPPRDELLEALARVHEVFDEIGR